MESTDSASRLDSNLSAASAAVGQHLSGVANSPARRHHFFLLAGTSGLVVAALIYAGTTIHRFSMENEALRTEVEELRNRSADAAWTQDHQSQMNSRLLAVQARCESLERTLKDAKRQLTEASESNAAREAELQKIIDFLREEIKAAEATIQGLKDAAKAK